MVLTPIRRDSGISNLNRTRLLFNYQTQVDEICFTQLSPRASRSATTAQKNLFRIGCPKNFARPTEERAMPYFRINSPRRWRLRRFRTLQCCRVRFGLFAVHNRFAGRGDGVCIVEMNRQCVHVGFLFGINSTGRIEVEFQ
jgi:hypothetical protein